MEFFYHGDTEAQSFCKSFFSVSLCLCGFKLLFPVILRRDRRIQRYWRYCMDPPIKSGDDSRGAGMTLGGGYKAIPLDGSADLGKIECINIKQGVLI